MVTASHNPPQDNGYKVYLGDGSQIVPPADAEISAAIDAVGPLSTGADGPTAGRPSARTCSRPTSTGWPALSTPTPRAIVSIVYTPLHGVGRDVVLAAFDRAGFAAPFVVSRAGRARTRSSPPSRSPTRRSPARSTWRSTRRAGRARRHRAGQRPRRRPVRGRGARRRGGRGLADAARRRGGRAARRPHLSAATRTCAARSRPRSCRRRCSARSRRRTAWATPRRSPASSGSPGCEGCASATRRRSATASTPTPCATRTASPRRCSSPSSPRTLKAEGRTLTDLLDDIARELRPARHRPALGAVRRPRPRSRPRWTGCARTRRPRSAGARSSAADDLALAAGELPPTDGLRYRLADGGRVIVRPSGTEPKLKCYLEVVVPVDDGDVAAARRTAAETLAAHQARTSRQPLGLPAEPTSSRRQA